MTPDQPRRLPLPATCGVAFKEWAGVCDALAEGRQSLIVRKGGIAEGPRGFVPEHEAFWLYPTHVHQAEQGLIVARDAPSTLADPDAPDVVTLGVLAVVDTITFVDREETLSALAGLHVWTEETIAKRFSYRKPGLWVLGVRAFRRPADPPRVAVSYEHAGCKTWVPLDPPPATDGFVPVLDDAEFAAYRERLRSALAGGG